MGIPYHLDNPCKIYKLEHRLKEVSGIQALDAKTLMCVEDEHRNIYQFDSAKKSVTTVYGNNKTADVEDLVIDGKTAYLLLAERRAVYIYRDFRVSMHNPLKIKLDLDKAYDPEGMCYSKGLHSLLIACKGDPDSASKRKVFLFDLQRLCRMKKPLFTLDAKKLKAYKKGKSFNPSAIAIHPKTREIYLMGTRSLNLIIRLNAKGKKIRGEKELPRALYKKPEGMTFHENGDLVIANEGKGSHQASIFVLAKKQ